MEKYTSYFQLYLRVALGVGYLTLGLDRLGVWGPYGKHGISWGDWDHFMKYAADVMNFLPYSVVKIFAAIATVSEISFGALLFAGLWTRFAAVGSGCLTFLFAVSMAIAHGITDPISYSVFTVSAGSFLLATVKYYRWSVDNFFAAKTKMTAK